MPDKPPMGRNDKLSRLSHEMQHREWEGCRIKSVPYVERDVRRRGKVVHEKNIDQMLKEFGRRVSKSGHLKEYRSRRYYTKPSEERRQAKERREYRLRQIEKRRD